MPNQYNRLAGVDFNLGSKDNRWNGKAFYHHSFNEQKKDSAFSSTVSLTYSKPKILFDLLVQAVGANFDPRLAICQEPGSTGSAPDFFTHGIQITHHQITMVPALTSISLATIFLGITDADYNLWYNVNFQNTAQFFIRIRQDYGLVFFPFDPTFPAYDSLAKNLPFTSHYYWNSVIANFQSDARKKFSYGSQARTGEYYNGHRTNFDGTFSYRFQPYAVISLDYSFNHIAMPSGCITVVDLLIRSPKFDFTFCPQALLDNLHPIQ